MTTPPTLDELQRFCIPGRVAFESGPGGLLRASVTTPQAQALIYIHGAHVAHYQSSGQAPLLFMSKRSFFDPTKPIRGGVPICFPWFGPRSGDPAAPIHGFVRLRPWTVESSRQLPDGSIQLEFSFQHRNPSPQTWPSPFTAIYTVTVGPTLTLNLAVHNPGPGPLAFEEAFHTYFAVGDVRELSVSGLGGLTYLDKPDGMKPKQQPSAPIRFTAETDRVYLDTPASCTLDDPRLGRRIIIEKSASNTTVVWNPWIEKAKTMADFDPDEWSRMLCIETANAKANSITLASGTNHAMQARLRSEPR